MGYCVKTYTPTVRIACPNHAGIQQGEREENDYRIEQMASANRRAQAEDLKKQAAALMLEHSGAKQTAKSIVARLLYQLDVASNVYITYLLRGICIHSKSHHLPLILGLNCVYILPVRRYTVMGLFFPTPLLLHKTGLWTRLKRAVFEFGKTPFMMLFVMSWW